MEQHQTACSDWHSHIEPTMSQTKIHNRVDWIARCAEARWPTVGGISMLRCIIQRESGGSPWAYNPSGSSGLLQIIGSTWASWFTRWHTRVEMQDLQNDPFDARSNLLLGVWAMQSSLQPWSGGCSS